MRQKTSENKKVKWLVYTVLVGLLPFFSRLIIFFVTTTKDASTVISAADFVAFGLVLHISNINEIEHTNEKDKNWKTIQNGTSLIFISVYSILYAVSLLENTAPNLIDQGAVRIASLILSIASFFLSYSIYDRLSHSSKERTS